MELRSVASRTRAVTLFVIVLFCAEVRCWEVPRPEGSCQNVENAECPDGFSEMYQEPNGDKLTRHCCSKGSRSEQKGREEATKCKLTGCHSKEDSVGMCNHFQTRFVNGMKLVLEEVAREECKDGVNLLCCPVNSKAAMQSLLLSAEPHQFPHYAMIQVPEGGGMGKCGGTIYNERYIVTASHCVLENAKMKESKDFKVYLDVRLSGDTNPNVYEVEQFIPHPNASQWQTGLFKSWIWNDVALIKLKKDIKFGPHIKALPLAKTGFDPFKYANEGLMVGVGTSDNRLLSSILQRTRTYLRYEEDNAAELFASQAGQVLFIGGIQNGTNGTRSGPGDSGGPAICRDEDGLAVLCGINSHGHDINNCLDKLDERRCPPLSYMSVAYYHDWIVSQAGDQKSAKVLKQPLFGATTFKGKYRHQVRITSGDGPSCGGSLIEKDVVVTAAHCVVDDNRSKKGSLKVFAKAWDVNANDGKEMKVKSVKILDGFKLDTKGKRVKRIARLNVKPTPLYPYYKNDLALVKLKSEVDIDSRDLLKIGPAPLNDGDLQEIEWTTEISYPTNLERSGKQQERKFQILEHKVCQRRVDRASFAGAYVKVDDNILCGEEQYNGGAQCDRELGGGLICKGSDGKDVLCGVQVFRFCQLALPSAFLDVNQHKDWIERNK